MFRARKEVFIDLLGWDLPTVETEYEIDEFDGIDARYLILLDEERRHRASARLLPTDQPNLLESYFSHLCPGSIPTGPTIFEITRFCLDRHQRAAERRDARNQLVTALAMHALDFGITAFTGVAELSWFNQIRKFGWACEALGPPNGHGSSALIALHIQITSDTPELLRQTGILTPLTLTMAPSISREKLQ